MNLDQPEIKTGLCEFFKKEDLNLVNRWILSRFYSVLSQVSKYLDTYKFNEAANLLYGFFWHEFCDWYLELAKPTLVNRVQSTEYRETQIVMSGILEKFLRILHPFMPFISEEIWQRLHHEGDSIMLRTWPHMQEQFVDKKLEKEAQIIFEVTSEIRNLRSSIEIKPEQKIKASIYPHTKMRRQLIQDNGDLIISLARLEALNILDSNKRPPATISAIVEDIDVYLHFTGLLDISKEQHKISQKISSLKQIIRAKEVRAKNPEFIRNAPEEIVKKEKESIDKLKGELLRLQRMSDELR
jgi:valyl-tRNA synthetase